MTIKQNPLSHCPSFSKILFDNLCRSSKYWRNINSSQVNVKKDKVNIAYLTFGVNKALAIYKLKSAILKTLTCQYRTRNLFSLQISTMLTDIYPTTRNEIWQNILKVVFSLRKCSIGDLWKFQENQSNSQDLRKYLRWRTLQQFLTTKSHWLMLQSSPSSMFGRVVTFLKTPAVKTDFRYSYT